MLFSSFSPVDDLRQIMLESFINKYSLSGIGTTMFAWFIDLDEWTKIVITGGTLLIIVFNVVKSYEQARLARFERKQAEKNLKVK